MKYLKFFESVDKNDTIDDVRSFCREHLVDLIDKGYNVQVTSVPNMDKLDIKISNDVNYGFNSLNWVDMKDQMINFIDVLNDNYTICDDATISIYDNSEFTIVSEYPSWYYDKNKKSLSKVRYFSNFVDRDNIFKRVSNFKKRLMLVDDIINDNIYDEKLIRRFYIRISL